jgi:hypothetical protein
MFEYRLIIERDLGLRQVVDLITSRLTGAAAYASGQIGQNAKTVLVSGKLAGCASRLRFAHQAGTRSGRNAF